MKISIALTNYNYGRYLGGALDSAIAQTRPADQIVVVDDGSTDESRRVLAAYEGRVEIIHQRNSGVAAATNAAIAACTGDVVAMMDADDLCQPGRLDRLERTYEAHPNAGWVFHGLGHVSRSDLRPLPYPTKAGPGYVPGFIDLRGRARRGDMSLPVLSSATSALSWRRDLLTRLIPMPTEVSMQDNYLRFASFSLAPGVCLDEELSLQGIHDTNMYTHQTAKLRRRIRAENAVATAWGYRDEAELQAIADHLIADAMILGLLGLKLPTGPRVQMRGYLREMTWGRRLKLSARLPKHVAVALRDLAWYPP